MISTQARTVLKQLKTLTNNTDAELWFYYDSNLISLLDNENTFFDFTAYSGEIHSIIDSLVNSGYAIYTDTDKNYFALTSKALHPYQSKANTAKLWFIDKSIDIAALIISIIALVRTF